MLFARFIGGDECPLGFTEGKVYIAEEGFSGESVTVDSFVVENDEGKSIQVQTEEMWFDFLDVVYAAWVGERQDIGFEEGEVVVIDDADNGSLHVQERGYYQAGNFVIFDWTNVKPGMRVRDKETGRWLRILRINDVCEFSVESDPSIYVEPVGFCFAVAEGRLCGEPPMLVCVTDAGADLTEGREYEQIGAGEDFYVVKGDDGQENSYMADRFSRKK